MDFLVNDFDNFSESSASDDQDVVDYLYGGQACSILSNLEETINKIDDFLLFERGFIHGDIVSSVKDPSGQTGRVVNVDMTVDLENIDGKKTRGVNSVKLQKIRPVSVGDYVVQDAWLGKVDKIIDFVTVLFNDGTKSEFSTVGPEKLIPITSSDFLEDSQYLFYPGQHVQVVIESSSISKSSGWFCGTQKEKRKNGVVCAVDPRLINVEWLGCARTGPAPPCLQDSKELTLLTGFSHATWQIGDWCLLPMDGKRQNVQEIAVIAKAKTKVDVLWQDGSRSFGLDSHSVFSVNIVDAHDFWPEQLVLEKGNDGSRRWGVVRTVDAKERTVNVKWIKPEEDPIEETVSAYELVDHPEYSFCLGDAVFKFQNDDSVELVAKKGEESGFFSCIGIVVDFKDGDIEVKWANGATSTVRPYEIYKIDKYEVSSFTPPGPDGPVEQSTEQIDVPDNQSYQLKEKEMLDFYGGKEDSNKTCWNFTSYSLHQSVTEIFSSITSSFFNSLGNYTHISDSKNKEIHENEEAIETRVEDFKVESDVEVASQSKGGVNFGQFDMVSHCLDHHFVGSGGKGVPIRNGWLKKVQQEWRILEKELPDTIYVRVYEERMDLLRAAIVGAPGTPYHDGLFFFDICLPPGYPQEPPMVYYNSGGLRLNPNLYESGKVCLSLLNTWAGSGSEVWTPGNSTILQVLLSLQALVLNEKPYFNEAGYDSQIGKAEGEKNSISYNENAFLVSCKSMLYTLSNPPKHFEVLVDEHFKRHGKDILLACKQYMEGAPIGFALGLKKNEQKNQKGSSTGFKIMLGKLFPRLVEAFSSKGIECVNLLDQGE